MKNSKKSYPIKFLLILPFLTFLSYLIGLVIGIKILLPILNVSFSYPLMVYLILKNKRREAVYSMLLWALSLIVIGTIVFLIFPEKSEKTVINGREYTFHMFKGIEKGDYDELFRKEFLSWQIITTGKFVFLSLISASSLSIVRGTIMVNYMNFYASQLLICSKNKIIAIIGGWPFWSLIRVFSFVILGVLLSEPLLSLIKKRKPQIGKEKTFLLIAISGLMLDIVLKTIFSPLIGRLLKNALF